MNAALYLRVSTVDKGQNVQVQEEPLRAWVERLGYEPVVYAEDGISGATTSRPVLDLMMMVVRRREVQAVAVWKLDRLGRSLAHLLQLLGEFEANGVRLLVHGMAIDTSTPQGKLFFSMVGAFSEFERALIAERVKDGMAHAKRHGTKTGRPIGRPKAQVDFSTIFDTMLENPELSVAAAARRWKVSRGWFYDHVVPMLREKGQEKGQEKEA